VQELDIEITVIVGFNFHFSRRLGLDFPFVNYRFGDRHSADLNGIQKKVVAGSLPRGNRAKTFFRRADFPAHCERFVEFHLRHSFAIETSLAHPTHRAAMLSRSQLTTIWTNETNPIATTTLKVRLYIFSLTA
jgi:hypothetical protein